MIVVVEKQDVQHLWNCMRELKPLSPPDGRWNSSRVCIAAAVCLFELLYRSLDDGSGETPEERVREHDEARSVISRRKLFGVMQLLGHLVGEVATGTYDGVYGDVVSFKVDVDGDDRVTIRPLSGFKEAAEGDVLTYDI